MFRERMVHWTGMLNLFTSTIGAMLVRAKETQRQVKVSFGRHWESNAYEREYERQLVARRAFSEFQSRLPVAR